MARGRHPHSFARAGGQIVAAAIRAQAQKSPTYQVIYQTEANNLITETARTASSVTFARVGITRDTGDEYFAQSEADWATISTTLVAHYLRTGIFQRIN